MPESSSKSSPKPTKASRSTSAGLRSGNPEARADAEAKVARDSARRHPTKVATNPEWWVPVMVTLLVLGLIWIVVFYITQGQWPVAKFAYWNLVAGFALLLGGFSMAMRWR